MALIRYNLDMEDFVLSNERVIRLSAFFGIFAVMALYETIAKKRTLRAPKGKRWLINLGITFLNTAIVRVIFFAGAMGTAVWAASKGWGLFNNIGLPPLIEGLVCVAILDLLIYTQHVIFHHVKPLWRLHMMHHTDLDIDVTTGARFHPVEIVLSMIIKIAAVAALGAPAWSVVVFEVILNALAMFNHSNVSLPLGLDRVLRKVIVTPDMHRVHHSVIIKELNTNFGFNLSIWDRIFGTYTPQPRMGHQDMTIGLANFRKFEEIGFASLMALPFTVERERL